MGLIRTFQADNRHCSLCNSTTRRHGELTETSIDLGYQKVLEGIDRTGQLFTQIKTVARLPFKGSIKQ